MKCAACGYEHRYDVELAHWVGAESFIGLQKNVIETPVEARHEKRTVTLYVCPKCGTVRAE